MSKNFFGGAIINSGPNLPATTDVSDGALFLKTGVSSGLYFYGFNPDVNPIAFGGQGGQTWQLLVDTSPVAPFVLKTGDVMSGQLFVNAGIRANYGNPLNDSSAFGYAFGNDGDTGMFAIGALPASTALSLYTNGTPRLVINSGGTVTIDGSIVWTQGNLTNLSQLANGPGYITSSSTIGTAQGGTGNPGPYTAGSVIYANTGTSFAGVGGAAGEVLLSGGAGAPSWVNQSALSVGFATNANFASSATNATNATTATNSTQLSGLASSVSPSGNTIVARDAGGIVYGTYLNASSANDENGGVNQIMITNGDNVLRKASASHVLTNLATLPATWTGQQQFNTAGSVGTAGFAGTLVAFGSGTPAVMSFLRSGIYGINMGLDSDNVFRIGGWSDGTNTYRLQVTPAGGVTANVFNGALNGNANTATTAASATNATNATNITFTNDNSTNSTHFVAFTTSSGTAGAKIASSKLTFNPSSGDFTAGGNVTAYSDRRLKENIERISDPLERVKQLVGVLFTRKGTTIEGTGLIAQDVKKVIPQAVVCDEEGYLSVAYGNLVGLLVEAINAQQDQIETLKVRLDKLEG